MAAPHACQSGFLCPQANLQDRFRKRFSTCPGMVLRLCWVIILSLMRFWRLLVSRKTQTIGDAGISNPASSIQPHITIYQISGIRPLKGIRSGYLTVFKIWGSLASSCQIYSQILRQITFQVQNLQTQKLWNTEIGVTAELMPNSNSDWHYYHYPALFRGEPEH